MQIADFERLAASATVAEVSTASGATVAAHLFGPSQQPAVVLVHGGFGSWNHWAKTIGPLVARFQVIALDLPGCGGSSLPDGVAAGSVLGRAELDALVDATSEAIERLVGPPHRFGLVGFSFGGIVAGRAAAAELGSRVALLALVGAGGIGVLSNAEAQPLRAVPPGADWPTRAAAHRHNLSALMLADERRVDELALALHDQNVQRSRFRLGDLPSSTALIEVLGQVRAPLLWLTGARDAYAAGVEEARRRAVLAARPDAELVDVPDAGHWAAYEAPDVVGPLLVDRLSRALAPPGP